MRSGLLRQSVHKVSLRSASLVDRGRRRPPREVTAAAKCPGSWTAGAARKCARPTSPPPPAPVSEKALQDRARTREGRPLALPSSCLEFSVHAQAAGAYPPHLGHK